MSMLLEMFLIYLDPLNKMLPFCSLNTKVLLRKYKSRLL